MCLTCGCMQAHLEMGQHNIRFEDVKAAADENGQSVAWTSTSWPRPWRWTRPITPRSTQIRRSRGPLKRGTNETRRVHRSRWARRRDARLRLTPDGGSVALALSSLGDHRDERETVTWECETIREIPRKALLARRTCQRRGVMVQEGSRDTSGAPGDHGSGSAVERSPRSPASACCSSS